jgi:glyoxylase-like metal-dependent hydrolase (beta-lactamase superfamily II)
MRRTVVLVALVAFGAFSMAVGAVQQAPAGAQAPRVVEVEKLKDNFFVLRGGGGNSGVFITANGVVVVDTKNPGWGQPLLDKIKTLTDKPITTIINTHTHGDHVSGNVEFPTTVDIVVHENTKKNMEEMRPVTGINPPPGGPPPNIFKANNGKGMAKRTFKDTMTIGSGNERIELRYFGRGHTDGDAWVFFPALRILHAGDIFSGKNLPLLDANNGGSGVLIGDTLAKAADSAAKEIDTIITGHSTQMTVADLRDYAQFNRDFLAAVREGKKAGKSVDDIANSWAMPAKYTGYTAPMPARLKSNVQVVYDEVK